MFQLKYILLLIFSYLSAFSVSFEPTKPLFVTINRNIPFYSVKHGGIIDWLRRGNDAKVIKALPFKKKGLPVVIEITSGKLKRKKGIIYYQNKNSGHYFNFVQNKVVPHIDSREIYSALRKNDLFTQKFYQSINPTLNVSSNTNRRVASINNSSQACAVLNQNINPFNKKQFDLLSQCRKSIIENIKENTIIDKIIAEKKICISKEKCSYQKVKARLNGRILNIQRKRKIKENLFKNMFAKLNYQEQRFLALTLTGEGEAAIFKDKYEMIGPMLTLDNRANHAQKMKLNNFTPLDAAIQSWAYSYWISNYSDWIILLQELKHRKKDRDRSVLAFMHYEKNKKRLMKKYSNVYHYHNNLVRPKWSQKNKRVKLKELTKRKRKIKHIYYRNIAWEPKFHEAKSKK